MAELFVGYVPVLHDGYIKLFNRHPDMMVGILGKDVTADIDYLRKDIRAIDPEMMKKALCGLERYARVIGKDALRQTMKRDDLVMPDDDVTTHLLQTYPNNTVQIEQVFLRWDRKNSTANQEVLPDRLIELSDDDIVIKTLNNEAKRSSNWWRRVGSALVKDSQVILSAHNSSLPTPYSSSIDSDPRIITSRGSDIDTTIDIHAEAKLIAEAAKNGTTLNGADLFVSTFPCPSCAKLIAASGIKSCYFIEGYATLDGQSILKSNDIEITKIVTNMPVQDERSFKTYPSRS